MTRRKPNYLKCIVIVHGKSEKQICNYIKSKLRFHMEIIGKEKGQKSIQINGLQNLFNKDKRLSAYNDFITYFSDVEIEGKKNKIASYFKIFVIMDTDDCSDEQRKKYISKELFKGHWAYDYIVPIFNTPDLENVMVKAGIKFEKKGVERKKEYIKIFPTDKKYSNREGVELTSFVENLKRVQETNLDDFVQCCLAVNDNKQ